MYDSLRAPPQGTSLHAPHLAGMAEKEDAVRASYKEIQRILATSHNIWSSYAEPSNLKNGFPPECVQLRNILGPIPSYPADRLTDFNSTRLKLKHKRVNDNEYELLTEGTSLWRTSERDCDTGIKTLRHHLLLGVQHSTLCDFAADHRLFKWPGVQNNQESAEGGNYLTVLAFAWAYILSARWIEMQQNEILWSGPEKSNGMQYSQEQAGWLRDRGADEASIEDINVNLGNVDNKAARWLAAILANGEGFKATIVRDSHTYRSPWSIRLLTGKRFQLRRLDGHAPPPPTSCSPPSYEAALGYLSDFCLLHNIHSQSSAALAACLRFPFLRDTTVVLPLPKPYPGTPSPLYTKCDIVFEEAKLLDYYMTISCNIWGVRALLCGAFFDPEICCNVVSPWLEPALEIITSLVREGQYERLAATMGKRQPKLAALWLGAILTGGEKRIFRDVNLGLSAVELHAAAWTGTVHSFIGPWSPAPISINNSAICRSDEARLLFLTECEGFSRVPVCPWQPFGTTPLEHTEIEVRQHAQCNGHCLQCCTSTLTLTIMKSNIMKRWCAH